MTEGISPVKMLISDENEENRMKTYELIAPCHFGLESVLKREIQDLGYDVTQVEDGKVTFVADADGIARANVFFMPNFHLLSLPRSSTWDFLS